MTTDSPEAQPQGGELLHWRFRAGVEETMCGLSVHSGAGAALLPEAATCPLCQAAFVGYKFGRADLPRATAGDDALYGAIGDALNSYRMRHTMEAPDLEHGLSLVDRLTPDDDKDVTRGREELDDLIDYVCGSVGDLFRADNTTPRATGETTVGAALSKLREMFPRWKYFTITESIGAPRKRYRMKIGPSFYSADVKDIWGDTLDDCMAQVRAAATRTEGEGEK